jgi:hypothetical protein
MNFKKRTRSDLLTLLSLHHLLRGSNQVFLYWILKFAPRRSYRHFVELALLRNHNQILRVSCEPNFSIFVFYFECRKRLCFRAEESHQIASLFRCGSLGYCQYLENVYCASVRASRQESPSAIECK